MCPRTTRRTLLQSAGLAGVAGLAGCQLRQVDPTTSTPTPGFGQPEQNTPTPGAAVAGDGSDGTATTPPTAGQPSDGSSGEVGNGGTPTRTAGRTFSFEVTNGITAEDLEPVDGRSTETPVQLLLDVEARDNDGEETVFQRELALPPETSETIEDAFTTIRNGPQYIVRAVFEQFDVEGRQRSANRSDAMRFTPGGFGGPSGTRLDVDVTDLADEERFSPTVLLREAEEG